MSEKTKVYTYTRVSTAMQIDGYLVFNEEEAEAIRTIFDRYVNKEMGANGVAKYLENHGIKKIPRANMKNDYNDRLYKIYDKIEELENLLSETRKKKRSIENDKVTADNVYKTLG